MEPPFDNRVVEIEIGLGALPALPPSPSPVSSAPLGARLAAFLLDLTFLAAFLTLFGGMVLETGRATTGVEKVAPMLEALLFYPPLAYIGYFTLLEGGCGQTFGKMIWGLAVTEQTGATATYGAALIRAFVSGLGLPFFLASHLVALFDSRRLTLHDRLAGTIVVAIR